MASVFQTSLVEKLHYHSCCTHIWNGGFSVCQVWEYCASWTEQRFYTTTQHISLNNIRSSQPSPPSDSPTPPSLGSSTCRVWRDVSRWVGGDEYLLHSVEQLMDQSIRPVPFPWTIPHHPLSSPFCLLPPGESTHSLGERRDIVVHQPSGCLWGCVCVCVQVGGYAVCWIGWQKTSYTRR